MYTSQRTRATEVVIQDMNNLDLYSNSNTWSRSQRRDKTSRNKLVRPQVQFAKKVRKPVVLSMRLAPVRLDVERPGHVEVLVIRV